MQAMSLAETHAVLQASEAETKKYEEAQQSEQSAFQASIVDLDQAVAAMQTYTDISAATAVAEEVHCSLCYVLSSLCEFAFSIIKNVSPAATMQT